MLILPKEYRTVDYLPRRAEANLQAEFYAQAKARGLNIFLEYSGRWNESPGVRFDAVIFKDGKIIALCEIKKTNSQNRKIRNWQQGRQGRNYLAWGLPVFLIMGEPDFMDVWQWAKERGLIGP